MLQINRIKEDPKTIIERLAIKQLDATAVVEKIIALDEKRRHTQKTLDDNLSESNILAKEIGLLYKTGKKEAAEPLKVQTSNLKLVNKELTDLLDRTEKELHQQLLLLPNLPHKDVPAGRNDTNNVVISEHGILPQLSDNALPHWELASRYHIIDFETGAKVSGAGFPFYVGKGAKLQRALISFFLDAATDSGYTEYQTPLMVNEASGYGTGQLPDKDGQMYHVTNDNLYLIPTAEVPLTNIFRGNMLKESDLPIKITAYSACFRREAGSYGKEVRGLNRLHQFDKVEIVQIVNPEKSYEVLEEMKSYIASLLDALELPYRIVKLCGGDLSFTAALTYDFEVFSAAQQRWLEVSSVSNFEDFQANRMKLRFKNSNNKSHPVHTLNGSALALPRILAALLENNQNSNGISIPKILVPYTKFNMIS